MRAAWTLLVAVACGGREAKNAGPSSGEPSRVETTIPATSDGGATHAPRACLRESRDPLPCAEDCDRGIATSCAILAVRTEHGEHVPKDATRAVMLFERACELKDAASCVSAARFHAAGRGVPPNRAKHMELLAHACVLGEASACTVPAKAFATGSGVARDEHRATELWQRGCSGGVETACDVLADAGL